MQCVYEDQIFALIAGWSFEYFSSTALSFFFSFSLTKFAIVPVISFHFPQLLLLKVAGELGSIGSVFGGRRGYALVK